MKKSQKILKNKAGNNPAKGGKEKGFIGNLLQPSNLIFYLFIMSFIIVLPLIYSTKVLDPALHIRLLVLVIFLLIFTLTIQVFIKDAKTDFSFLRNKIIWFLAAYFIITAISAFFAYNHKESFFDINKTFAVLILVVVAVLIFNKIEGWPEKISVFVLIAAAISLAIGFYQYDERVINATTDKAPDGDELIYLVKGLMAHKNMYSSSLMLMLPFLGYGIFRQKGMLRFAFVMVFAGVMSMILLLSTRSVWLGIILAVLAMIVVLIFAGSHFNLSKKLRQVAMVLSVVVLSSAVTFIFTLKGSHNYSVIERIKSITQPGAANNPYRLKIWDISLSMVKDYPLTGVGAGNWKLLSPRYYQGYGFKKDQLNWVRPHNDYLWVFSEKGIVGLISFLGIFVMLFFYIARIWRSNLALKHKVLALLVFGGIIGYMTDALFSFPLERIDQQVYFGLMTASVIALHQQTIEKKEVKVSQYAVVIPAILMFSFTIMYCISELKMEAMVRKARELHVKKDWNALLDLSVKIPTTFRDVDAEVMPVKWYEALALGSLERIEEARDAYLLAVKANPTRVNVLNNLGRTYFQLGDYENARKIFDETLSILPNYFESLVNMASTLYQLKEYEKSLEYWEKIPKNKRNEPIQNNIEMVKRKLSIR